MALWAITMMYVGHDIISYTGEDQLEFNGEIIKLIEKEEFFQ